MFDLTIPQYLPPLDKALSAQLTVAEPTAFSVLDSDRIQSISETGLTRLPTPNGATFCPNWCRRRLRDRSKMPRLSG